MTVFTDKAKVYMPRLMKDLVLTKEQAAGIFGNIGGETGGFAALQEKKPTVAGSKGGYGWLQWTGPRRKKFEAWCKTNSLNPAADETNYRYLIEETLTDEGHSLIQLRKTKTIEAATETFMSQNLRPGIPNLAGRINYAKQAALAVQDVKKDTAQNTTVAGAIVVGTGTVLATPHHMWPWILGGTFVVMIVSMIAVHFYHEHQKQEIIATPVATKGKKTNG